MPEIILMKPGKHEAHVRELFWEYLSWANNRLGEEYGIDFDIRAKLEDCLHAR